MSALAVRLAAFLALAGFAIGHWVALLDPAPAGKGVAVALVASAAGIALAATGQIREAWTRRSAQLSVAVFGTALALLAAGLPLRLLSSENWADLASGVADGIGAAGNVRPWPYSGEDAWLRLTVMLGAAPVAVLAAAAAFWPLRRGVAAARAAGLALLVALFAVATAAAEYDAQVLRGAILFTLIALWLWLPRVRVPELAAAAAAVATATVLAGIATTRVNASEPLVDYRNWSWSDSSDAVRFDWRHGYGPLDWPRRGTTLLAVRAPEAHYWKAQTLDYFDGRGWTTLSFRGGRGAQAELVAADRRGWTERIRVTVRGLRTDLVVGAGTIFDTGGDAEGAIPLTDGTYLIGDVLETGDVYDVQAYVPDPSAAEMRRSEAGFYDDFLRGSVTVGLRRPNGGQELVEFPLRGSDPDALPDPEVALAGTPYERVGELARRLARGRRTAYDVVKAVERYLERNHDYRERVPTHRDPLPAFLFEDRRGYCQHFSGAMALLLRMNGIPTRVVSGFTPGSYDRDTGEFRVRDFDAHSWVEVWFKGIGWVPFDPTPTAAPARSQGDSAAPSVARGGATDRVIRRDIFADGGGGTGATEPGGARWPWLAGVAALGLAAAAFTLRRRTRRPRSPLGPDVDYLLGLLAQLGFRVGPGTTLLALEERLARLAGPAAAAYPRRLRRNRYAPEAAGGATPADRRDLRRALARAARAGPFKRAALAVWARAFRFGGP